MINTLWVGLLFGFGFWLAKDILAAVSAFTELCFALVGYAAGNIRRKSRP
jgi:hypothetical protein